MPHLQFNSIELQNFMSVEHINLNYQSGITIVYGINEDELLKEKEAQAKKEYIEEYIEDCFKMDCFKEEQSSKSNGSGKSTILTEAPRWVLFGNTSKDDSADDVINEIEGKDCYGKLNLTLIDHNNNSKEIEIVRYRKHTKHKNTIHLFIDGQDKTVHGKGGTQKAINDLIKLPEEIIISSYLMEQGMSSRFSLLTNKGRRDFIENLRPTKVWEDSLNETRKNLTTIDKERQGLQTQLNSNTKFIESHEVDIEINKENLNKLNSTQSDELIEQELIKLRSEYKEIQNKQFEETKQLSTIESKLPNHNNEIDNLNQNTINLSSHIATKTSELNKLLKNKKESICGLCRRPFENVYEHNKHIEEETTKIKSKLNELEKTYAELKKTIEKKRLEKHNLEKEIKSIENNINQSIISLSKIKSRGNELKTIKDGLLDRQKIYTDSIFVLNNRINSLQQSNTTIEDQIKTLNKQITHYTDLAHAFSFKGLRSHLIINDINFLNEKLYEYSKRLYADIIIQLDPGIDEVENTLSTLDIKVLTCKSRQRSFKSLSGGEKRRGDICIQLAIRDLIKSVNYIDTNLCIIDEIFEGLDKSGIDSVIELLCSTYDKTICMYIISHNQVPYQGKTLNVVKSNGKSYIC